MTSPLARIRHPQSRLVRCFPSVFRVASDNMDPLPLWASGAQQAALNLQTCDLPARLNSAFFAQSGDCGVVLKPKEMREDPPRWSSCLSTLASSLLVVASLMSHVPQANKEIERRPYCL